MSNIIELKKSKLDALKKLHELERREEEEYVPTYRMEEAKNEVAVAEMELRIALHEDLKMEIAWHFDHLINSRSNG
jgi:hypothetical protein